MLPAQDWAAVERHSIDFVPLSERHGRVTQQGPLWFLGNFHFFTVSIGFVGPGLGLGFGAASLAGVLGIVFGTLFMAFHAAQGPELGLPQMIQSRAQFGYTGVIVPLIAALCTFVGFNIVDTIVIASGLQAIWGVATGPVMLALAVVPVGLAIWGHDWVHRAFRMLFRVSLPLFVILTLAIVTGHVANPHFAPGAAVFTRGAFLAQFVAAASYNITYAPYVSDFSRYLPPTVSRRAVIGQVYAGAALSAIWMIALGAWLATHMSAHDAMTALYVAGNQVIGGFGLWLVVLSVGALVATMGMNAYSGMLTVVTGLDSIRPTVPGPWLRIAVIVGLAVLWLVPALSFGGNAIDGLNAMLIVMLNLLVPWTAINLVDYFVLRKGHYDVAALARADGVYGRYNGVGIGAYFIGLFASLPFFDIPGYWVGPIAHVLGDLDFAWAVGLLVGCGAYVALYYLTARR
jgi:purine-cytosine permease-like protein